MASLLDSLTNLVAPKGDGTAVNTINLRKAYNDYNVMMQTNGQEPLAFEEWAKKMHPGKPILTTGFQ